METSAPQLNEFLPAFSLPAVWRDNNVFIEQTLSNADFAGKPFVLFFYPKDATCGCTIEVCGFRDLFAKFQSLGVALAGCSRDTISSHKKFIAAQDLPFPLLSDTNRELAAQWNLLVPKTMYGKPVVGSSRDTFIVDAGGKVRRILRKVSPPEHAREVLDTVCEII